MQKVVFGSRGSDLALTQTRKVIADFQVLFPDVHAEIKTIRSKGDDIVDVPIAKIGTKGVFTKEIETALLAGEIDVAVHSLKDLPTDMPEGLMLAAIPKRENPYDAWLGREHVALEDLPEGARVGTSSERRRLQLLAYRPDLQLVDVRGNVQTRIDKMRDGQYDAIILAMAGLHRLGLEHEITHPMTPDIMLPAVGQGALGIQCRAEDTALAEMLAAMTHPDTRDAVYAERALLRGLGGGCQTPVGVAASMVSGALQIRAVLCIPETGNVLHADIQGLREEAEQLGKKVAEQLIAKMRDARGDVVICDDQPLRDRRVVVTRAREQAGKLADALAALGAEVLEVPCIQTVPIPCQEPLPSPEEVDWIVFTSVNGVRHFQTQLEQAGSTLTNYAACSLCAIGPATAKALNELGLTVSLSPPEYVAEVLLDTLKTLEGGLAGKRFLLPRGNLARDFLPEALREAGARVHECVVYETRSCQVPRDSIQAMLHARPDAITFTSASSAQAFRNALGESEWQHLIRNSAIVSIGPKTSEALGTLGVDTIVQATQYDIPGLVEVLIQWSRNAKSTRT